MGIIDLNCLQPEDENLYIPKFQSISKNMKELSDRLNLVGSSLSDSEMENIIFSSYYFFLDESFLRDKVQRDSIVKVFTDKQFIRCFTNIIAQQRISLTPMQTTLCNHIAWEIMLSKNVDPEVKDLMLQFGGEVAMSNIMVLSSYLGRGGAILVSLAVNSSFDRRECISRVNRILASIENITPQQIVDVYSVLFSDSLTSLFEATLFDTREIEEKDHNRWNLIFYALMTIMDNVDSRTMETVLIRFVESYNLSGHPPIRFSIQHCKKHFPRVENVVNELMQDGIIVP